MSKMSKYSYAPYVNSIAITALRDYPEDVKNHPDWGWIIQNSEYYNGEDKRHDIYSDSYGCGYSFATAVMIAAQNKEWQPENDIYVKPSSYVQYEKDKDICKWCLFNNRENGDYTTLENMAAGRGNIPGGGVYDGTYDREYYAWIINQLD